MSTDPRKDTRRLALGPGFTIRFQAQGRTLEVPILNLSYGGCFTLVPFKDARHFDRGVPITELQLLHPDLPKGTFTCQVAYTLGGTAGMGHMDQVGMGIQFLEVDPITQRALQAWLDREWDRKGL